MTGSGLGGAIALAAMTAVCAASAQEYVLNSLGEGNSYYVQTADEDGLINSPNGVPRPTHASNMAWPSAVIDGSTTVMFASLAIGSKWDRIARLTRTVTGWHYTGDVLVANASEPHGIGPAWVGIRPDQAERYVMVYGVRTASGPAQALHLATSTDGIQWVRRGAIIAATSEAPGGIAISYVCQDDDGRLIATFLGLDASRANAVGMIATAATWGGPWTAPQTVIRPFVWSSTMQGRKGSALLAVPVGSSFPIGHPLIVPSTGELIVPKKQSGKWLWAQWPLLNDYSSQTQVKTVTSNKVDPSYIKRTSSGWVAHVTAFGATADLAEYVVEARAGAVTGPWTWTSTGFRFSPFYPLGVKSTENPQPIARDVSCRN